MPRPAAHRPNSGAPAATKLSACQNSSSETSNCSIVSNRSATILRTMAFRRASPALPAPAIWSRKAVISGDWVSFVIGVSSWMLSLAAAKMSTLVFVERDAQTGSLRHGQGEIFVAERLLQDFLGQEQRAEEFGAPFQLGESRKQLG